MMAGHPITIGGLKVINQVTDACLSGELSPSVSGAALRGKMEGPLAEKQHRIDSVCGSYVWRVGAPPDHDSYTPTPEGVLISNFGERAKHVLGAAMWAIKAKQTQDSAFRSFSFNELRAQLSADPAVENPIGEEFAHRIIQTFRLTWAAERFDGSMAWARPEGTEHIVELADVDALIEWLAARRAKARAAEAEQTAAAAAPREREELRELNRSARRLLRFLHQWHLKAAGRSFTIAPEPETFSECALDEESYRAAAGRLVTKGLAKWSGLGGVITITPRGVAAQENQRVLSAELEVEQIQMTSAVMPADQAAAFASCRDTFPAIFADHDLLAIVQRDLAELERALAAGLHKSTMLLAGSITEAILLDVCNRNPPVAAGYLKQARDYPEKASLDHLIDIAQGEGILVDIADKMAVVRSHRDLIHPECERRTKPLVDGATAGALVALLRIVVRDVKLAIESGSVAAYAAK